MASHEVPGLPTEQPRLRRLFLPSVFAIGTGATDGLLYVYLLESIRSLGGSSMMGLGSLAAGAAASLVIAPLAAAVSDIKLGGRKVCSSLLCPCLGCLCQRGQLACGGVYQALGPPANVQCFLFYSPCAVVVCFRQCLWDPQPLTLVFNLTSLLAAAAVAIIVGTAPDPPGFGFRDLPGRAAAVAVMGAVYRALTLSSPSVPTLIETSLHGEAAGFPVRRDVALSFFYIWTRMGTLAAAVTVFVVTRRQDPMWFILTAVGVGLITLAVSCGLVRRPPRKEPPPPGSPLPPRQSVFGKMVSDQKKALLHTPPGLLQLYVVCFLYGVAYGQFNAILGPYYSSSIFKEAAGTNRVVRWTALATFLNLGVGILVDAFSPKAAKAIGARASRWLWPGSLLIGAGLFAGLAITSTPRVAVTLLSAHAIPIGATMYFSLVGAGAIVHPSLRATTFGARTAAMVAGNLVGSLVAGGLAQRRGEGYRDVMTLSAATCVAAALVAAAVGEFPPLERAKGVATNANVLFGIVFGRRRHRSRWGMAIPAAGGEQGDPAAVGGAAGGAPAGDVEAKPPAPMKLQQELGTAAEWSMDYWKEDEQWYWDDATAEMAVPDMSPLTPPPTPPPQGGGGGWGGGRDVPTVEAFAQPWRG